MTTINQSILSGRYEIQDTIGQGSDGIVYLARHKSLEIDRAIKVFSKNSSRCLAISEANILKAIHHPGIPTIYDLEEDDTNYYLVEEFIQGESLSQFLLRQVTISQNLFINFSLQLCDIFRYLHSMCPIPVIYQDLKPEHIIICGLQLKLIDFSVSHFSLTDPYNSDSREHIELYGNAVFSAPELALHQASVRSDIYSIGKIMEYMLPHVETPVFPNCLTIIQKATHSDSSLRYETVESMESAIHSSVKISDDMHLYHNIAVIGTHSGCGATHLAISLVCALNASGYSSVYYEENDSNHLQSAIKLLPHLWEKSGYYYMGYFKGRPNYWENILVPKDSETISVSDYGNQIPVELVNADLILIVCGGGVWTRDNELLPEQMPQNLHDRLRLVANLCDPISAKKYASTWNAPVYYYPLDINPFQINKAKSHLTDWLSFKKGRYSLFSRIKSHIFRQ